MKHRCNATYRIFLILFWSAVIPSIVLSQYSSVPVSDLDSLYQTLIQNHPKLIGGRARAQFDSSYENVRSHYFALTRNQRIFEMTKLVASMHDGHSSMAIRYDTSYHFHELPIKLYVFEDGIFITRAAEPYGKYAGMKVLRIGDLSIDSIEKRMLPLIHGDNRSAVKDILPSRLIIMELLEYVDAISSTDHVAFVLEDSFKRQHTALMKPALSTDHLEWVSARDTASRPPLYLHNPDANYWFTYIDSLQLFYFQFNVVQDMQDVPFEKFVDSMFVKVNALAIRKMVIDIRRNNGGDNTLNKPLIHALIRCEKVNQKGMLFVIIGRNTFSAAVNLTADLESNTNAIFVGEPTAAGPNHYGETSAFHLPASKLLVLYSSQYWQSSFPWDKRSSIDPAIPIKMSSADFRNNQDPCLAAIIKYSH